MIRTILPFEFTYRFSKPITYIFLLMLVFQGVWYTIGTYNFYINDATLMNASGIFYQNLSGTGMLLCIVIAIITGTALFKDIEYKSAGIIYTLPIHEKKYFLAKFNAAFLINVVICMGYPLGMILLPYLGVAPAEQFGPTPWGPLVHGFLIFTIPNILLLTTICIAGVVFFRNMTAGYVGVFMIMVCFLIAESTRENTTYKTLIYLLDPMGYTITSDTVQSMSLSAKNYSYFPLLPLMIANRLLWIGISALLGYLSYRKFRFKSFITAASEKVKKDKSVKTSIQNQDGKIQHRISTIPIPQINFSGVENIKKLFRLAWLELKNVIRPAGFKLIIGITALMFFLYNLIWNAEYYISSNTLPITSLMTFTRLPNGVFILILLTIWAGELLFKEKTVSIWQITDSLPVPTWVTYFSKFFAMAGVAFLMATTLFVCGVLAQAVQGFFDIDWLLYIEDIYGFKMGWMTYIFMIALAFFLAGLTGSRFATHILGVAILLFLLISEDLGLIEQIRYYFPFVPGSADYSEMNGYGIFGVAANYYALMWGLLVSAMLLTGAWWWSRGAEKSFLKRMDIRNPQLSISGKVAIPILLIGFVFLQSFIVENVNETGNFQIEDQEEMESAEYEKRYKYLESAPQPTITGLDVSVDIFPQERKANYRFTMRLLNPTQTSIDTLHISLKDFVSIYSFSSQGEALQNISSDERHQQYAYLLPSSLAPNEEMEIEGELSLHYVGFSQGDPQSALTFNGSLMGRDILPVIGYNSEKELTENRTRKEYQLSELSSRMASIEDSLSLRQDVYSADANWHKATIQVSTSSAQTAFAPGILQEQWNENGRNYYRFEMNQPSPMQWYIGSATYQKYEADISNTDLTILHDPRHTYNVESIEDAVQQGITFIEDHLDSYPYSTLTVVEVPFYEEDDFYAYSNIITISEKQGWTADGSKQEDLADIYYNIVRELAKQWVFQNIKIADVRGADMLRVALPEAVALQFIKETFGEQVLGDYIRRKEDRYKKDRGGEPNFEPALVDADGTDYLEENKGALAMYNLIKQIGEEEFYTMLTDWTGSVNSEQQNAVFKDFYVGLKSVLSSEEQERVTAIFETVE
ncbi:ABC transporter permease/M1 family aminopeptidase [Rhodohalobacter sp. 614A]|uniref:ABC transporter permease/M1 family aminopeptidase n=1 Tax=Rhodohalobacter sp. 614A TaxID=2908649 RepID=UPI001F21FAB7|nr:hypothetical protein [Rhodohalobacter sp. 614A]